MKIKNQEELKKLFEIVEKNIPLEDEEKNKLKDPDQELVDLYEDTDSF